VQSSSIKREDINDRLYGIQVEIQTIQVAQSEKNTFERWKSVRLGEIPTVLRDAQSSSTSTVESTRVQLLAPGLVPTAQILLR
jgi:hypothetical protein